MFIYWDENNKCDCDTISVDDKYIIIEDCARNTLRINKKTLDVDILINDKWESMDKKVYKYE